MDRALEIRLEVYRICLVRPQAIEFCPVQGRTENGGSSKYRPVHDNAERSTARKLLCASKRIHAEASPILYGQNEFRSSSQIGRCMLYGFLRTIGPNISFLRNIVVTSPWSFLGPFEGSFSAPLNGSKAYGTYNRVYDSLPFLLRYRRLHLARAEFKSTKDHPHVVCLRRTLRMLEKANAHGQGALRSMTVIVTEDTQYVRKTGENLVDLVAGKCDSSRLLEESRVCQGPLIYQSHNWQAWALLNELRAIAKSLAITVRFVSGFEDEHWRRMDRVSKGQQSI